MANRDELIESCRGMVVHYARRLIQNNAAIDLEDAIGEGNVGLVRAANAYDPSRGVAFSTFAAFSIQGAILDAMRKASPGSRAARREFRAYESVRSVLTAELGRDPDESEVAQRMNVDESKLEDMHRYRNVRFVSMDAEFDDGGVSEIGGEDDTEDTVLRRVEAHEVRVLLASLMPREREIVHRHYIKGESQKAIADDIGVSESRISQIQRRALSHLRSKMTGSGIPVAA